MSFARTHPADVPSARDLGRAASRRPIELGLTGRLRDTVGGRRHVAKLGGADLNGEHTTWTEQRVGELRGGRKWVAALGQPSEAPLGRPPHVSMTQATDFADGNDVADLRPLDGPPVQGNPVE